LPQSQFNQGTNAATDRSLIQRIDTAGGKAGSGQAADVMAALRSNLTARDQQASKLTMLSSVSENAATKAAAATSASPAGAIKKLRVDDGPLVKNAGVRGLLTATEMAARDNAAARQGVILTSIVTPSGVIRGRL
jgi:hypothetical protein